MSFGVLRADLDAVIFLRGRHLGVPRRGSVVEAPTENPIRQSNEQKEPEHGSSPVQCRSVNIRLRGKGQEDDDEDTKPQRK